MSMPVSEVLEAARPLNERILAFLRAAPDQAYSLPEIYVAVERLEPGLRLLVEALWTAALLEGKPPPAPRWGQALQELVAAKQVVKSSVRGTDYYYLAPEGPT